MWEQTAKQTFTAASSISVNNCFSANYIHYEIFFNASGTVSQNNIDLQLRASGTNATGANYRRRYITVNDTSRSTDVTTGNTSFDAIGVLTTTSNSQFLVKVSNPFEATRTTVQRSLNYEPSTNNPAISLDIYAHDLSTSYDGFTATLVQGGAGSLGTMTGTVIVYGLKES